MAGKKQFKGLALGVLLGITGAFAPSIAQETFSDEHLKYTREVMQGLRVFNSFDQIIPTMAEQARALFVRNNPALVEEVETATTNAALALIARRSELDDQVVQIWAARFTTEELKEISGFFNSPSGQKFASQSGVLLQDSAVAAKEWGDRLSVEIMDMVQSELAEVTAPTEQ